MEASLLQKYIQEALKKYSNNIEIEHSDAKTILEGEKIPSLQNSQYSTMTLELLKLLLSDSRYSNNFLNILVKKNCSNLKLLFNDEKGKKDVYNFSKFSILEAGEWAKDNDKLNSQELKNLNVLKNNSDFVNFKLKYEKSVVSNNIITNKKSIKVNEIINILEKDKEEIEKLVNNNKVGNLNLVEFMILAEKFFRENKIFENYKIPESIVDNYNYLFNKTKVTSFKTLKKEDNSYLRRVLINKNLKNKVFENMSSDFDDLEKAFYVYFKLCNLLTYDDEYYARRNNTSFRINHKSMGRLLRVDEVNNRVICHEFNAIYAYLLKCLGIRYELRGSNIYGVGHASLYISIDDYLIHADSTEGLISSDLSYAKNGLKLKGFKLENNPGLEDEFNAKLQKVYQYIATDKSLKKYYGTVKELNIFSSKIPTDFELKEKTGLLVTMSNNSTLPPFDKIPYQLELRKHMFSENRNTDKTNCALNYLSMFESKDKEKFFSLACLITTNDNDIYAEPQNNEYIILKRDGSIDILDYKEINREFNEGNLASIITEKRSIPGFSYEKTRKTKHL